MSRTCLSCHCQAVQFLTRLARNRPLPRPNPVAWGSLLLPLLGQRSAHFQYASPKQANVLLHFSWGNFAFFNLYQIAVPFVVIATFCCMSCNSCFLLLLLLLAKCAFCIQIAAACQSAYAILLTPPTTANYCLCWLLLQMQCICENSMAVRVFAVVAVASILAAVL